MKTYVKVKGEQYPAKVIGRAVDSDWGGRSTKTIELALPFETVLSIFQTGVAWSIVVEEEYSIPETTEDGNLVLDEHGNPSITTKTNITEYDNSGYYMAGPITDRRDGVVTVKMGMPTSEEKASTAASTLAGCSIDQIPDVSALRQAIESAMAAVEDAEAVKTPSLSKKWVVGEAVNQGDRRYYEPTQLLYKCKTGHTTQADWTPDKTPAMWVVIDIVHEGTREDPIPASRGMEYEYGKYYLDPEDQKTYLCKRTGAQDGEKIVLQFLPHELIDQYFVAA